jgi:hypothetical protein
MNTLLLLAIAFMTLALLASNFLLHLFGIQGTSFQYIFLYHKLISAHQHELTSFWCRTDYLPHEDFQAHFLQEQKWTQRAGYNWTQSKEGFFSKEALDQIQDTVPSRRTDALLFVGIFCRKEDLIARTLIRQTSMLLAPPGVVVKFVICHGETSGFQPSLWAEMQQHQDLYLIDCVENMNEGKSLQYFVTVRRDFPGFSYYSKADTDTYILFHNVARALDASPRCLFYGGLSRGAKHRIPNYISGSFYILSCDLVMKLEGCGQACPIIKSDEDVIMGEHLWTLVGEEIQYGDFGANRTVYYDLQSRDTKIEPRHILLHPLKAPEDWWRVHTIRAKHITAKEVREAEGEHFWDGPYTTIRHTCQ